MSMNSVGAIYVLHSKTKCIFHSRHFIEQRLSINAIPEKEIMLKFLSKVKIEFNALDPRTAACMEFLAQCNARKAKESNPSCQLLVKRRTDSYPPQISVTFVNGVEEVFDATATPAQTIRKMILEKGQQLETEQMFREAGEKWPVVIPEEELRQSFPGTKPRKAEEKKQ